MSLLDKGVLHFDKELHALYESKLPISASKIQLITKAALKYSQVRFWSSLDRSTRTLYFQSKSFYKNALQNSNSLGYTSSIRFHALRSRRVERARHLWADLEKRLRACLRICQRFLQKTRYFLDVLTRDLGQD